MPLLKRKAFEKSSASGYLRDDDEVFHCEITDEIFKDYEEYCARIILVNSMVWTCEMTGKSNLTYSEALTSEKAARKQLKDFPMELRIPILYIAERTNRSSFAEMADDIFNFVRDRYFVGETVEACLSGEDWCEAHILSVTAQKQHPDSKAMLPSSSYCYEVEQFDEADATAEGQIGTAPFDRVRRRKGVYSRDKSRLFLKQFVEARSTGIIGIKQTTLLKYNISKVNFNQIFTGKPPDFPSSKKLLKNGTTPGKSPAKPGSATKLNKSTAKPSPNKKGQQSMDKFVKKTDKPEAGSKQATNKQPANPAAKKSAQELAEKMRRAEEQMRQRKEEEKNKKKEKASRLQAYLKEWQRVKDDLELEDHKILPKGTPIDIEGIPQEHIGDFFSVLEFVHTYADVLKAKDAFHNKFDLEMFRKSLTSKEHAGAFSDLVQMFLTTVFALQEDEAEEYNENKGIQLSTEDAAPDSEVGVTKAIELATKASKWSQTYLGTPLSKQPLDPTSVSEVLRLHLLSSGAAAGARCATWRYTQRGGYSSQDDAGLRLRVSHPHILRRLACAHVSDLPLDEKFLILQCLMNQVLSYATVRDVIEERVEECKNKRQELRTLQINERKREAQVLASKQELNREARTKKEENKLTGDKAKEVDEQVKAAVDKLNADNEKKRREFEEKMKELQHEIFEFTSYVGTDRAYRRYWLQRGIPGLFVEAGGEARGPCRDKLVLPASPGDDTLAYVTKLFETQKEKGGSDKENDSAANSRGNSPKKPLGNLNGLTHKLNGIESNVQQLRDLLMCTGETSGCPVHGKGDFRPRWFVYHTEEHITSLIQALNKRGIRENDLRSTLEGEKANIVTFISKCPVYQLNPAVASPPPVPNHRFGLRKQFQPSLAVPADCSLGEALELSLRDHILELEEKIFHGCLGAIKVKDREAWRGTIMLRGYDKQADFLSWGPQHRYRDDYHLPDGVLKLPADSEKPETPIAENKYRDPGHYLAPKINGVKVENDTGAKADVVRGLASALLQVSQAIHHKYIKRPLGLDEKERKDREARNKPLELEALSRWEVSLMECRSFAQVVLHLLALDSSVAWSSSILHASCRICRRKADPDNMLLCDGCNKGHHLYCLKPKLSTVPEGDWFCDHCKPKERTPRKRRKLFTEDDIEDELNSEEESMEMDGGVCGTCGSGGRLAAACADCGARYHAECAEPRPARAARRWLCGACRWPQREPSTRPCAVAATSSLHEYARTLDQTLADDSEDSEYGTALVKLKGRKARSSKEASPVAQNGSSKKSRRSKEDANSSTSKKSKNSKSQVNDSEDSDYSTALVKLKGRKARNSKEASPVAQNGSSKKSRRSKEDANSSTSKKSKHSLTNGEHEEKATHRKRGSKQPEVTLHTEALEQLVKDVMKHKDCWPFYDPVSLEDVPDYLDVISRPMDFTAIKETLARGEYRRDDQLLADAALVLRNCYVYNRPDHPVAKSGCRLEKYINKRCAELNLPPLPEIDLDEEEEDSKPLKRPNSSADQSEPTPKRAKLK